MEAETKLHCRVGPIDPTHAAQATRDEWSLVTEFVKRHEDVMREAGGITAVYPQQSMLNRTDTMAHRSVVSVVGAKRLSAVVDVSRSGASPTFTLACVSVLPPGKRDPFKDVCAQ